MSTVPAEVANLTTAVDGLTTEVTADRAEREASVASAATSATTATNAATSAGNAATSAGADAAQVALDKAAAAQALADAQAVAYGTDPVFDSMAATGEVRLPGLPELSAGLGLALSILGALARRINGEGAIELAGGSLADPAITVGSGVKVYSATANTLSIAIADTEVLRVTADGINVYGTVTEVP